MKSGVYKIENQVNGKIYIGSSIDMKARLSQHIRKLISKKHINRWLQRSFDKYGEDSFNFLPLVVCEKSNLIFYEQLLIDGYKSNNRKYGYNFRIAADTNLGMRFLSKIYKSGDKYGRLTLVKRLENSKNGSVIWKCICDCGKETVSYIGPVKRGRIKSCGCLRLDGPHLENLIKIKKGDIYGRLTLLELVEVENRTGRYWKCQCNCGKISITSTSALIGGSKSCGCLVSETSILLRTTHGLSKTLEYKLWKDIRGRCNNKNHGSYSIYGAKGIKLSEEWNKYDNFIKDMGNRPEGSRLIRKDKSCDFNKDNCYWGKK